MVDISNSNSMAVLPFSHSEIKSEPHRYLQYSPWLGKSSSASEMPGRVLIVEAAAGARMNKAKMVKIVVVSVLATMLLMAASLSIARYSSGQLRAFFGSDYFLMICVATHVTSICLMAGCAATARTPAARRYYAESTVASTVHLAANLYFVLVACPKNVQDAA